MSGYIEVEVVYGTDLIGAEPQKLRVTAPDVPPFLMDIPDAEKGRDWQDTIYDAITAELDKRQP